MNIRAEIQAAYRTAFFSDGDREKAWKTAGERFANLAGYVPSPQMLDRLLQGAVLGHDHALMQLLAKAGIATERLTADRPARGLRLTTK